MNVFGERTWIELDRSAVHKNTEHLQSLLGEGVLYCAVVKANAYGHGLKEMVSLLKEQGVQHFAVDSIDEAIEVRKDAPQAEVFVLGHTVHERLHDLFRLNAIQTVSTLEQIIFLSALAQEAQKQVRISLKIETGTMRQGIEMHQLPRIIEALQAAPSLELASIHSHFAYSEEGKGEDFTFDQYNQFADAYEQLHTAGLVPKYVHISSSAASTLFPELQGNMARFGIMSYGIWPSKHVKRKNQISSRGIELYPVLSWRTRIIQVRDIKPGTTVGYGRTFLADRPMRIAVLPVGYYDGYRRAYRDKAEVIVHGQRCRVLGSICMNMMMIDVSHVPNAGQGDLVTLLGRDGMHRITAEELAEWGSTIAYEALTQISSHLPRKIV
jgi:alanine racemase